EAAEHERAEHRAAVVRGHEQQRPRAQMLTQADAPSRLVTEHEGRIDRRAGVLLEAHVPHAWWQARFGPGRREARAELHDEQQAREARHLAPPRRLRSASSVMARSI